MPRMNWRQLLSTTRVADIGSCAVGPKKDSQFIDPRSDFEKDCDQIIFSYPFRRLQDKTQVIPFPEYDFVHTRLTHSLEVASVGRSFGKMAAELIFREEGVWLASANIAKSDIGALIAGACLAHDIGNPPFGHSGEDAISYYFESTTELRPDFLDLEYVKTEGGAYFYRYPEVNGEPGLEFSISFEEYGHQRKKWVDLSRFEGNANGFRILTQNCDKGINPTIALIGAFTKYPKESWLSRDPFAAAFVLSNSKPKSQTKYGFFQSERLKFKEIADALGLIPIEGIGTNDIAYRRHPLAFLMEASDDIAYGMIDFEDGCKLGLIDFEKYYCKIKLKDKKKPIYHDLGIDARPVDILVEIAKYDCRLPHSSAI